MTDAQPPEAAPSRQTASVHRDAVRRLFDSESASWGDRYDRPATTLSQLDVTERLKIASRMARAALDRGGSAEPAILDLGCGTGEGTSQVCREGITVVAADLSHAMVSTAVGRFPALRGCAADAERLPFASETFDLVQSLGVLEYVRAADRALLELRRVLKPGGTLVISIPNRLSLFRRLNRLERSLSAPLRRWRDRRRGCSRWEAGFCHRQWSLSEAVALLGQAGFEVVDHRFTTYGLLLPAAESWRVNLALCRGLNARLPGRGFLGRQLATTAVLQARAA